ncbi:MAG TPA: alpha/beta hydrolase [Chloroflexota bacterium]|nr:alpha/beta hydrolase [Chloroflexota bacterium]
MKTLVRDGVRLAYEEAGSGEQPLLLVHGWACDHTYLAPQIKHFSRRHRVIAVDLRGHGESDKPEQDYTMALLAGDLAWLCDQLELRRPVLVGHSMGGVVGLELLASSPGRLAAIVALDSPIVLPAHRHEQLRRAGERLHGPGAQQAVRDLVAGMFLPTDNAARKAGIVERMSSGPPHVLTSAWEQYLACPSAAADRASEIPVPLLAIASAGGHMADLQRLRQLCPRLTLGQTVGAGHFHQLEVPEQTNAMIERFLAVSVP